MVKAKDELGGYLTNRGGVRKILDNNDKKKLHRGYQRAREILQKAGARGIFKTAYLAAHPGGTVKIGDLLDSDLKTEYDNLYVCDCSVIPEAWGLPPTLTIIGLGKRLAKHLTDETIAKERLKDGIVNHR
jgi:choline dehydrogenase-like flavoprotein